MNRKEYTDEMVDGLDKQYILSWIDYECLKSDKIKESDPNSIFVIEIDKDDENEILGCVKDYDDFIEMKPEIHSSYDYDRLVITKYNFNTLDDAIGQIIFTKNMEIENVFYNITEAHPYLIFNIDHEDYIPYHDRFYNLPYPFKNGDIIRNIYTGDYYISDNAFHEFKLSNSNYKDSSDIRLYTINVSENGTIIEDDGSYHPYEFELVNINQNHINKYSNNKNDIMNQVLYELHKIAQKDITGSYRIIQEGCNKLKKIYKEES